MFSIVCGKHPVLHLEYPIIDGQKAPDNLRYQGTVMDQVSKAVVSKAGFDVRHIFWARHNIFPSRAGFCSCSLS